MLNRKHRIQGESVVESILEKGSLSKSAFFFVYAKENGLSRNRYGIMFTKKLEKSSVKRNRKRRQIYEILRSLEKKELVPSEPSFDRVLIARKGVPTASFEELEKALKALLIAAA